MLETKRRRYTDEFKSEAVCLVRETSRPMAQVARELGIGDNVLYCWMNEERQAASQRQRPPRRCALSRSRAGSVLAGSRSGDEAGRRLSI